MSDDEKKGDSTVNVGRRRFLVAATSVVGAAGAAAVGTIFVGAWQPSAKAKAAGAPVKVNINKIKPGEMITEEWRGKPVYIIHRTQEAVAGLEKVTDFISDPDSEKSVQPDYAKNKTRSIKPNYMIMLGVCTHLGCAPKFRPEVGAKDLGGDSWQGGFFCPCHGSRFDLAGRVYKSVPAPTNLEIPPHSYVDSDYVLIGEDSEGGA